VNVRAGVWNALIGVTDPQIVEPLIYALENDSADRVRAEAAAALAPFVDLPVVRDALTRAAAEVPAERPACCYYSARSAARLTLRAREEDTEAVRKTVLDESLTPQERLVLVRPGVVTALRLD
jgi:hypothetical protein